MKTDKTKNWTDSWKEQLDEYSVTPPPEVWEELSKELAPRRIPLRKRTIWWAAACITLLLCTFIVPSIKQKPLDIIAQSYKPIRAPQTPDRTDVENHTPSQINESRHIEQRESSEPEKSTPEKKRDNAQTGLFSSRNENTSRTTIHTHTQPKTKPKSTWSLGVSLGNNLIASADNRNGFSNLAPYASAEMACLPSEKNLSNSEGPVTTPYQHIMLQNVGKMCSRRTLRTIRNEQSSAVFQRRDSAHKPIAMVRIGIGRNIFQTGIAYKPLCRTRYCLLLRRWIGHLDYS